MDRCQRTTRSDFFTNALQAFEINNGLYVFPTSFGFEFVGINTTLPQPFIDRFTLYSQITHTQLINIFLDLMANYSDEFGHLKLGVHSLVEHPRFLIDILLNNFVDFNNRTSNLTDPLFITQLENMYAMYEHFDGWFIPVTVGSTTFMRERAGEVAFVSKTHALRPLHVFYPLAPYFTHYIPVVDEHGNMIINTMSMINGTIWSGLVVTALADGDLAWEFIQYVIEAYAFPVGRATVNALGSLNIWGHNSFYTPIKRSLFEKHFTSAFNDAIEQIIRSVKLQNPETGLRNPESYIQAAIARLSAYHERPMVRTTTFLTQELQRQLIGDHFDQFMHGIISAEVAAQRMHNAMTLWLIE